MNKNKSIKTAQASKTFKSIAEFRKEYSITPPKAKRNITLDELAKQTADRVIKEAEKK